MTEPFCDSPFYPIVGAPRRVCWAYRTRQPKTVVQNFSNFSKPRAYESAGNLVEMEILIRVGLGWGFSKNLKIGFYLFSDILPRFCISYKLPGNKDVSGPRANLSSESLAHA